MTPYKGKGNMIIRNLTERDLASVQALDQLLFLSLQYFEDYRLENAFGLFMGDQLLGAGTLHYHASWHAPAASDVLRMLTLSLYLPPDLADPDPVRVPLIRRLIERMEEMAQGQPDRRIAINAYVEDVDGDLMQLLLENGFTMDVVIPVLGRELDEPIAPEALPPGVTIEPFSLQEGGMEAYVRADTLASGEYPDSPAETWFRTGIDGFMIFVAKRQEEILGAVTVWNAEVDRAATENIFVVPKWRRQGIASALVNRALRELRGRGKQLATLSVRGDNRGALRLYHQLGYSLRFLILEMRRTPDAWKDMECLKEK